MRGGALSATVCGMGEPPVTARAGSPLIAACEHQREDVATAAWTLESAAPQDRDAGQSHENEKLAAAWRLLREHPALQWTPPLWRDTGPTPTARDLLRKHAWRSVERNFVVDVGVSATECRTWVRVTTGPLQDRPVGDGVDPLVPAAVHDPRLDVMAATFEQAVIVLAHRVLDVYGPPHATRDGTDGHVAPQGLA